MTMKLKITMLLRLQKDGFQRPVYKLYFFNLPAWSILKKYSRNPYNRAYFYKIIKMRDNNPTFNV